ncbi:MAG: hypothetical protein AAGA60_07100 [Cyanobacteria bacterium P01_E01_bin.42]
MKSYFHRWEELFVQLGGKTIPPLTPILLAYGESHRYYHGLRHLEECLSLCDCHSFNSPEVEAALWFHDVIYNPREANNEEKSADYARQVLEEVGIGKKQQKAIANCILATRHDIPPDNLLAATVISIDLAILGSDSERYREYSQAIRLEYNWLSDRQFNEGRDRVLRSLLQRPKIFLIEPLFSQLEDLARINIQTELQALKSS